MIIERLIREKSNKKVICSGITFKSFAEVYDYCFKYGSQLEPRADILILEFKIIENNEIFEISITWDKDKEVCVELLRFLGL